MVTLENLLMEIKNDFKSYYSSGLLDEISMERWAMKALKMFGVNIMTLQEELVEVENKKGVLPDNFFALYAAYECEPNGYVEEKVQPVVQSVRQWKEVKERVKKFNSCDPCCVTEEEKIITEKIYLDDRQLTFHYRNPKLLKLGRTIDKKFCADGCRNKVIKSNKNEIIIRQNTVYTNYPSGTIYLLYYGLDKDENDELIIPETPRGEVANYVEYYVKYRIVEQLILNQDDSNLSNMLSFLDNKVKETYNLAQTDAKFMNLSPDSFKKLKLANMQKILVHENQFSHLK